MGLVMLFTGVYVFPNPFVFRYIIGITGIMLMFIGLFVYIYKEAEKLLQNKKVKNEIYINECRNDKSNT